MLVQKKLNKFIIESLWFKRILKSRCQLSDTKRQSKRVNVKYERRSHRIVRLKNQVVLNKTITNRVKSA